MRNHVLERYLLPETDPIMRLRQTLGQIIMQEFEKNFEILARRPRLSPNSGKTIHRYGMKLIESEERWYKI